MTTLVKIHRKGQMPVKLRSLAGISEGDLVEAAFQRGKIVITPPLVIDRSQFSTADEEYTPAHRRAIDARLAKSDEDIRHGRVYGPFNTAEEMAASVEANIKTLRAPRKKTKPGRRNLPTLRMLSAL
jgi:bifunctional DNA-binding transcriptional regulator/antitoxin component of YhaV-PrlF toxin-antitoxin module